MESVGQTQKLNYRSSKVAEKVKFSTLPSLYQGQDSDSGKNGMLKLKMGSSGSMHLKILNSHISLNIVDL